MELRFELLGASEVGLLAAFLGSSEWPFHQQRAVDTSWVRGRLESGYFLGEASRSFWIRGNGDLPIPIGFVRVFDLHDATPLFDLRVGGASRGRGVGTAALTWLTRWVFEQLPETDRLGGYTRHDNLAMRRVFEKSGFALEAHHRRAWRIEGAPPADAVGYAILRSDLSDSCSAD